MALSDWWYGSFHFFKSLPYSSDWQNETPHQCIWRINGRKYRSGYCKSM
jgi:hypothetical protein